MAQVELIMPKMGESIMEATILKWVKKEGDEVEMDETILEIATDKVDSEVPSPVDGKIVKILFPENETVGIGEVIALIETEAEAAESAPGSSQEQPAAVNGQAPAPATSSPAETGKPSPKPQPEPVTAEEVSVQRTGSNNRFYSPLVRNIAEKEQVSMEELEQIPGSGLHGRVTKKDILAYLEEERQQPAPQTQAQPKARVAAPVESPTNGQRTVPSGENVEIIEMDRMRRLIADHMVQSKRTSPHVTSFVEADVTNIVNWRNAVKKSFEEKYGEKITFTPIFIEAIVQAIHDFPLVNISVDGDKIIRKNDINIGMATALPSGNLIVPVIKKADRFNLLGLTEQVNDLANRARNNKLKPEDIQDGTFTLTNVGTFGNVMGTPIINQPQVAILATGAIRKKPAVVETEYGDLIAVRHMMFLSLSYDHRVVDGFLGGSFLRRIADYLEGFDPKRTI
jgi:2-oxoglutarate dehydrogenase E2 component (dihydrolipoamide succinyltransferase)